MKFQIIKNGEPLGAVKITLKGILLSLLIVGLDIFLLWQFPPQRWPYLWPQPAISIVLGAVLLIHWLQQRGHWTRLRKLRVAGCALLFLSQVYVLHSIQMLWQQPSPVAALHAFAITWISLMIGLNIINQLQPRSSTPPPLPDPAPAVAAVIPTYGEPLRVLEPTLRSLCALAYPAQKLHVYISDDGHRPEVARLAERYGVHYNRGAQRDAKAGNLNSCLPLIHQTQPDCDIILTQDADEVIDPSFLQKVIGYFTDEQVAFVQTPKECIVPSGDPFGNRDRIFYDSIQLGRNGVNAAFACGSGVAWRISAVEAVGGFNTWNMVEDMTTSYELHSLGYRSEYHNEVLSVGLAPDDILGILKQRGTWAADTLRMFLYNNPLTKRGRLSLAQRFQYLELGLFYITSAFIFPLALFVPVLSLLLDQFIGIEGAVLFPWIIANALYYIILSGGSFAYAWRHWQYWVGHIPTYQQAFWVALRSRREKPRYVVTRKTRVGGFHGGVLWGQFLLILLSLGSIALGLRRYGPIPPGYVQTNMLIVLLYASMLGGICRAAFYGVRPSELPLLRTLSRARSLLSPPLKQQEGASSRE